ncbi:hypothetical protein [Nitrospira sp. Nam80]
MSEQPTAIKQIMEIIVRSSQCELEEVAFACPGLTWNQVFLAIDRLSREGAVMLHRKEPGRYIVSLPKAARGFADRDLSLKKKSGGDSPKLNDYLEPHTGARPTM